MAAKTNRCMNTAPQYGRQALAKILFPGCHQRVVFFENNLKNQHLEPAAGVVAFGQKPSLPGWRSQSFDYVNNPDGSIRWLYPSGLRRPLFLQLYNGSGWRGFLLRHAFRAAFSTGLRGLAKSGTLHVFFKNRLPLAERIGQCEGGDYAVFTGTVGENRKAVVFLKNGTGEWFYKLPLTAAAGSLVQNEGQVLAGLEALDLQKMQVPRAVPSGGGLLLTNVRPKHAPNHFDLQTVHFEAIAELSEKTVRHERLGGLPFWGQVNEWLAAISEQLILNDLPAETVAGVVGRLHGLRNSLDPGLLVPTALAHGDFTPWNMFAGEGRLHVYDWELSERLPLLFDAFHFVFQSGVLVKRQGGAAIVEAVLKMRKNRSVRRLLKDAGADFELLYQLYLLRNVSYYLLRYLRQVPLHGQAHWQLQAWEAVLGQAPALPVGTPFFTGKRPAGLARFTGWAGCGAGTAHLAG